MTDDAQSDEEHLIDEARRGSTVAFSQLVSQNQIAVRGFVMRMSTQSSDVDDIAQEAFIAAWSQLQSFRGDSSFRSWVCSIAYRKFIDNVRSGVRRKKREAVAAESDCVDNSASYRPDSHLDLVAALKVLPPELRAAVTLCLVEGFSHSEAAVALTLPVGTVKSHILRARAKLLSLLGDAYEHD